MAVLRSVTRLSTGAFAVLVAATIAAFFVTQHLKVTTPLIQGAPRPVPGVIDPLHGVPCIDGKNSGSTTISFYLQHRADTVDVYVVNDGRRHCPHGRRPAGTCARTSATPTACSTGTGARTTGGSRPDGTYYFRVALLHQGRTVDLKTVPVKVKTVPPHPVVTSVTPSAIPGPGGSNVTIHYAGNENRGGTVLIYRTDLPGGPRLVKIVPDALERPNGGVGRHDRRASGAAGHLSDRDRGHRRRLQHRPLPRSRPLGAHGRRCARRGHGFLGGEAAATATTRTVCHRDGVPEAPGELARGLPGRRRGLEVHRGPAAAGLHAVHPSRGLRRRRAARRTA